MSIEIMRDLFSNEKIVESISNAYTVRVNRKAEPKSEPEESLAKKEYEMRKAEREKSIADQSMCYAEKLRAARNKSKATSLQKKKLQYNFKKISSMIIRSKNSVSARKAVQSARREVTRLNRLKGSGEYDEQELQLAIDHAKAMVKVAKKKVHHLEQEEMIERGSGGIGEVLEEREDDNSSENDEMTDENSQEAIERAALGDASYYNEQQMTEASYDEIDYEELGEFLLEGPQIQDISIDIAETESEAMTELMSEFSEEMESMMEELDLTDLAETMYAPDPNMSEDDLKMLKIKHRTKELKEIAEADKEYLKKLFAYEESKKNSSSNAVSSSISGSSAPVFKAGAQSVTPIISMPGAAAGASCVAPMSPVGIDVSV
ncbi:hypothetical protein [Butyrivibrio sp. INlla21]|uniref:hypothetical protein n=1 Tax=Butyrivibrio sp. INlla21 TaxID=1520811 RepID=UPI0008EE5A16|nr:hypothetical protein [Butyrivibrio sp. INlla21]SFU64160.1 hypothetical protein SAMN02910342_01221 [Butyrivibrio sp. INlla21]